jgi:hypothetical protein
LILDILYRHRDKFAKSVLFSGTTESSGDFAGVVPDVFTYDGYSEEKASKYWQKQKQIVMKRGKGNYKNQAVMIIDDCMHDTSWVRSKTVADIFMNGRHYDMLFILAMQYCMGILPGLRTCVDYIFICPENSYANKKKLHEHYCSIFPDFKMFAKVLDALTVDYQCIVVKQRKNTSTKIEDNIFWYKADLHPKFKIGSLAMWEYQNMVYNPRYRYEELVGNEEATDGGSGRGNQNHRAVIKNEKKQKAGTIVINMKQ